MRKRVRLGTWLILGGLAAVMAAGGLWFYNLQEQNRAADFSAQRAELLTEQIHTAAQQPVAQPLPARPPATDDSGTNDSKLEIKTISIDGDAYIVILSIPALALELPINCTWSYPALRLTPCRYSGSAESNTLVIAAHNYDKHFGKLASLEEGEIAVFTDVEGNQIRYRMALIETVQPSRVEDVVTSGYDMTLFTCTYGGQSRVVVRWMRA